MDRTPARAAPGRDTPVEHRLRRELGRFPAGVTLVTTATADGPTGTAVDSCRSVWDHCTRQSAVASSPRAGAL